MSDGFSSLIYVT